MLIPNGLKRITYPQRTGTLNPEFKCGTSQRLPSVLSTRSHEQTFIAFYGQSVEVFIVEASARNGPKAPESFHSIKEGLRES